GSGGVGANAPWTAATCAASSWAAAAGRAPAPSCCGLWPSTRRRPEAGG
ncbi:MAG: hypothetical protein AVDCRST_MAG27-807, partial [uncultured Craurococcus sp.]